MTPHGDYKKDPSSPKPLNLADFIEANWSLVWETAEYPELQLKIIDDYDFAPSSVYGGLTIQGDGRWKRVFLNIPDLVKDCHLFTINAVVNPFLWSGPCAIARQMLVQSGTIPRDQLITKKKAIECGIKETYFTWNKHKETSPEFVDMQAIQGAVYQHVLRLERGESLDMYQLKKIMRLEKDQLNTWLF